jgi:hypothetical protein
MHIKPWFRYYDTDEVLSPVSKDVRKSNMNVSANHTGIPKSEASF